LKKLILAAALVAFAGPLHAQTNGAAQPITDAQFAEVAAMSNMFEIESSRLALQKAQAPEVKTFAQKMIDDHTKVGAELKSVASGMSGKVKLPQKLDAEHQAILDALKAEEGNDFDDEYIDAQVEAHQKAVNVFGTFAKSNSKGELNAFAQKNLPALEEHLQHVEKMD
jgi:putative membrane protein